MLVILRENVENLGRIGDLVNVSAGFARNFLLPRKLVVVADETNKAMIENQKKLLEKKRAAAKASSQELAGKLGGVKVTISRKVGDQDKLFGSVSTTDIAEALKKAGHTVEKRMIALDQPLKALGVFDVVVKLDQDINSTIKVWVVKEE
jgi:large subunit ribosomal protein L9